MKGHLKLCPHFVPFFDREKRRELKKLPPPASSDPAKSLKPKNCLENSAKNLYSE